MYTGAMERLAVIKIILLLLFLLTGCSKNFNDNTLNKRLPSTQPEQEVDTLNKVKNLAVYYGWPGYTNSDDLNYDTDAISDFYRQYDMVIFGPDTADSSHRDHSKTVTIIANIRNTVEVFGYISIGDSESFTMTELKAFADNWDSKLNVHGILLDESGFDNWSGTDAEMRSRQKEIIDYIHSKNLKVILNAKDPDDLFVKESSNKLNINSSDYYLYESYIINKDGAVSFNAYREKIDKLQNAKSELGIGLLGVSTTNARTTSFNQSDLNFLAISAHADKLDAVGWGTADYSYWDFEMPYRNFIDYQSFTNVDSRQVSGTSEVSFEHKNGSCSIQYDTLSFTCE